MSENDLDRWRDRMVAALYGELSPAEMQEFEAAIAEDDDLRGDWRELQEARQALRVLEREPSGGVDFELPPAPSRSLSTAEVVPLRRTLLQVAAGFAAAMVLFSALLIAGLRVDRAGSGLLVSFDRSRAEQPATTTASDSSDVLRLSRAELAALAQVMVDATAVRLDDLERRQTDSQTEVARALYDALAVRQQQHYSDLRARIDYAAVRGGSYRSASESGFETKPKEGQGHDYD